MNAHCKIHGFHDSPISGCPDCKKQMLGGVVKKWSIVGCTECEEKNELLKEMAEALEEIVRCLSHGLQDCRASVTAKEMLQKYHKQIGEPK